MAYVEIRDHAVWIKHVHGDAPLAELLLSMRAGDIVELEIDGHVGTWRKMDNGKDGRPTPGLRPLGKARVAWLKQQERRGELVTPNTVDRGAVT